MDRAYSTIEIKSLDDDAGLIEGVASTPSTDRMGDVVEPKGAKFTLPMPLLWQHDAKSPIGQVIAAKTTDKGIAIKAVIAKGILPEIDRAWSLIKAGLVKGLSIGFRALEHEPLDAKDPFGGQRFTSWEWMELSAVTIPANAEASILSVKAADEALRAASGAGAQEPTPAGVAASMKRSKGAVKMKPINEQISAFEQTRKATASRMDAIMAKAAEEGRTLDESEREDYDTAEREVQDLDAHLERLQKHAATMASKAVPVTKESVEKESRPYISVHPNQPKGTGFTRYAMALAASRGNLMQAHEIAKARWGSESPEVVNVLKTAVAAGTTTTANWATELADYTYMASEFVDLLRPATILGRIQGLRRVPFMIRMPATASGVSVGWVGQSAPKPVSKMDFDTITLAQHKMAVIVVLTEELVRFSNPSAEAIVRQDMIDAISTYMDQQFIDPTVSAVGTTSPASITNGVTGVPITGTAVANVLTDIQSMWSRLINGNITPRAGVWVMHPRTALYLSLLRTAQDVYAFPGISMTGGTFLGLPVVTSANVPVDTGDDTYIVLMDAAEIWYADDGGVTLDVSREASLQMDDAPTGGAQSLVSLWQNNLIGLRAERYCTWKRRRDAAVAVMEDVSY